MSAIVNRRLLARICSACQKARMQTITCRRCGNACCAHLITTKQTCFACVGELARERAHESKAVVQ